MDGPESWDVEDAASFPVGRNVHVSDDSKRVTVSLSRAPIVEPEPPKTCPECGRSGLVVPMNVNEWHCNACAHNWHAGKSPRRIHAPFPGLIMK